MREVVARVPSRACAVLGICNGFQILAEAGLLPGALLRNADLRFICQPVGSGRDARQRFTGALCRARTVSLPIAHHDGNYFIDRTSLSG